MTYAKANPTQYNPTEDRMYRSVMVPLDGSAFSEQAIPLACVIAQAARATLRLVRVYQEQSFYLVNPVPIVDLAEEERRRTRMQGELDETTRRVAAQTGLNVTSTLLDGLVAPALVAHAAATQTDLLVFTSHGRGGLSRFWLGSTTDAIVRQTETPLLVIRPEEARGSEAPAPRLEHILIPLDGSALAEDMLEHALTLGLLSQARYTLVQAIDPDAVLYASPPAVVRADEQGLQQQRAAAASYLEGIAERLRARGAAVQTAVVLAAPAPAILAYAHDHDVDLIAMSTRGRGGVARLLLGSVADKVLRGASMPLLLHRPARPASDEAGSE
jgi:nucleotide-binding universal stress UspA family protein